MVHKSYKIINMKGGNNIDNFITNELKIIAENSNIANVYYFTYNNKNIILIGEIHEHKKNNELTFYDIIKNLIERCNMSANIYLEDSYTNKGKNKMTYDKNTTENIYNYKNDEDILGNISNYSMKMNNCDKIDIYPCDLRINGVLQLLYDTYVGTSIFNLDLIEYSELCRTIMKIIIDKIKIYSDMIENLIDSLNPNNKKYINIMYDIYEQHNFNHKKIFNMIDSMDKIYNDNINDQSAINEIKKELHNKISYYNASYMDIYITCLLMQESEKELNICYLGYNHIRDMYYTLWNNLDIERKWIYENKSIYNNDDYENIHKIKLLTENKYKEL